MAVTAALLLLQLTPFQGIYPTVLFPALLLLRLTPFKAAFADVFDVAIAIFLVCFAAFDVARDTFVLPFPVFCLAFFACVDFRLAQDAADLLLFCCFPFGFSI